MNVVQTDIRSRAHPWAGQAVPGPVMPCGPYRRSPPRGQPRRNSTGASASEPIGVIFNMMTPS